MSIKVNQTPVRTSRNFGINNLTLESLKIPEKVTPFDKTDIKYNKSTVEKIANIKALKYGNGEELTNNVVKNSNHNIKIKTAKEDIFLTYNFDDKNTKLSNQVEIEGIENANVFIQYKSNTEKPCFHNGAIKVSAKENCKLNIVIINLLNNKSQNFEAIQTTLENNAEANFTIIDLGAKTSVSNYYADIQGEGATNNLKTVYLGKDNEIKDLNYIAELRGEKSNVDIDVQGALNGNCKKHFKGTIDFKTGCKKSKGNENEFCLLLSDKAKSIALPMLLCTEHDVEGNHSTASGQVDAKSLFYIMSRGISYKEAVKLIVKSNFNQIVENIKNDEIKEMVINEIDRRLD